MVSVPLYCTIDFAPVPLMFNVGDVVDKCVFVNFISILAPVTSLKLLIVAVFAAVLALVVQVAKFGCFHMGAPLPFDISS